MIRRLLQGDPRRRTRLHDFEGHRVPLALVADVVPSIASTLALKLGRRGWSPWWPYVATRRLAALVRPGWRVLEFGAGASTAWLAPRVAHVTAMESNPAWYVRVRDRLGALGLDNVDLRLRPEAQAYADVDGEDGGGFDLVVVDGDWRDRCARTAVRLVRPGGYIYLDNSDVPDPDHRHAVATVLSAAATSERLVGFGPNTVSVNQGLLVRVKGGQA
jgi:predicted O-methyltransferase YrrM